MFAALPYSFRLNEYNLNQLGLVRSHAGPSPCLESGQIHRLRCVAQTGVCRSVARQLIDSELFMAKAAIHSSSKKPSLPKRRPVSKDWMKSPAAACRAAGRRSFPAARAAARPFWRWSSSFAAPRSSMSPAFSSPSRRPRRNWPRTFARWASIWKNWPKRKESSWITSTSSARRLRRRESTTWKGSLFASVTPSIPLREADRARHARNALQRPQQPRHPARGTAPPVSLAQG